MRLTPSRINNLRGIVTWVLRALGLWLILHSTVLCVNRILFGFANQDWQYAFLIWEDVGEDHGLFNGVPMFLVGVVLAAAARPLSRWIITMPPDGCPRCGQVRTPGADDRCPECGLTGLDEP